MGFELLPELRSGDEEMKKMTVKMDREDFGTLCICAIRYCHGRQTYMPSLVREIIQPHLSELDDKTIGVMVQDCEYQERFSLYGDEHIDKKGWLEWRKTVEAEQERRKPQGAVPM